MFRIVQARTAILPGVTIRCTKTRVLQVFIWQQCAYDVRSRFATRKRRNREEVEDMMMMMMMMIRGGVRAC